MRLFAFHGLKFFLHCVQFWVSILSSRDLCNGGGGYEYAQFFFHIFILASHFTLWIWTSHFDLCVFGSKMVRVPKKNISQKIQDFVPTCEKWFKNSLRMYKHIISPPFHTTNSLSINVYKMFKCDKKVPKNENLGISSHK